MAKSGIFKNMGLNRRLMGVTASFSPLPLASVYGSIIGAFALVSAVFRNRCGDFHGFRIEVPLASALQEALVHNSVEFDKPDLYMRLRERMIRDGRTNMTYAELFDRMDPFYAHYICSDGRPVYLVAPSHKLHQERVLSVLGIQFGRSGDPYSSGSKLQTGLGCVQLGDTSAMALKEMMVDAFKQRTSDDWVVLMGAKGIPISKHYTTPEWLESEHATESGLSQLVGGVVNIAPIAWFENAREVSDHRIPVQGLDSKCLSSIRVLDFSNVIAGPTIGTMLARMGADVIKVDPITPNYAPDVTVIYGLATNMWESGRFSSI